MLIPINYQNNKTPKFVPLNSIAINLVNKNKPIYTFSGRVISGITKTLDVIAPINNTLLGIFNPVYVNLKLSELVEFNISNARFYVPTYNSQLNKFIFSEQLALNLVNLSDVNSPFQNGHTVTFFKTANIGIFHGTFANRFFRTLKEFSRSAPVPINSIAYYNGINSILIKPLEIFDDKNPTLQNNLNFSTFSIRNICYLNKVINVNNANNFIILDDSAESYEIIISENIEYVSISFNFTSKYKRIAIYNETAIISFSPSSNIFGNIYFIGKVNIFNIIKSEDKYFVYNREINVKTLTQ